ncbi:MAG: TlpA family protein disulfide reductase [Deferribacteraceae bacterium]|jgi:thiol-disulfide isomerase/thioredoxin|nr:TlpA family protein disulfide reductase [Deferribacteraceae bacterium]
MKKTAPLLLIAFILALITACSGGRENAIGQSEYEKIKSERSGKVLVVNVFASWCPPCAAETPGFVSLYAQDGGENFEIVGLSIDENRRELDRFLSRYKVNYPTFVIDETLQRRLFADKVPTTVIYYPDGEYYATIFGAVNKPTLLMHVEKAQKRYAEKN